MCFRTWLIKTNPYRSALSGWRLLRLGVTLAALVGATATSADISKASDWVGRSVVTSDGQPLGRIEDIAIDVEAAEIKYLVVSIGSFLIEDSLIAVHPDALAPSAAGAALVLFSDSLEAARRFGADGWPAAADVLPAAGAGDGALVAAQSGDEEPAATGFDRGGSATISDGRRRATFADGEGKIEPVTSRRAVAAAARASSTDAPAPVDPRTVPLPSFQQLDSNGDGVLSRREIGARLSRQEPFPGVDVDASGAVDRFEFDLLKQARENAQ